MRLRTIEFYQSVRLWNNAERKTIDEGDSQGLMGLEINLEDHLVKLTCSNFPEEIIVPTANMRHGRAPTAGEILVKIDELGESIKENMEKFSTVKMFHPDPSAAGKLAAVQGLMEEYPDLITKEEAIKILDMPSEIDIEAHIKSAKNSGRVPFKVTKKK